VVYLIVYSIKEVPKMDTTNGISIFSDEYLRDEVIEKIKRHADHFLETSCDIERTRDLMDNVFKTGRDY
jgi:hypothetical protein